MSLQRERHAAHTRRSYATGVREYARFVLLHGYESQAFPATDEVLSQFVAYKARSCKPSSIKVYLCGIRSFHLENGWDFPPLKERFPVLATLQG